jgi:hypothetical protein
MQLPDFAFVETANHAVVVVGRVLERTGIRSPTHLAGVRDTVRRWAERTGLPLAVVHTGTCRSWDLGADDLRGPSQLCVIGLVTAFVSGQEERELPVGALDPRLAERIPSGLWHELEDVHDLQLDVAHPAWDGDDDDDHGRRRHASHDYSGPGVYLAPAGWSWASIRRDGEHLASSSSDSTYTVVRLDDELGRLAPLVLCSGHC